MQEIDVFLLRDDDGMAYIKVEPELVGVHSGDSVFWHFHSVLGEDVNWVELDVKKGSDGETSKYFETRSGDPQSRCWARLNWGHGHLLATVPDLTPRPGTRNDKYFVRGYKDEPVNYDPNGAFVHQDPNIIVCDP